MTGEAKRRARARAEFERQRPEHKLGDAPIEAEHHERLTEIAAALDRLFNGGAKGDARAVGFVLMVFPFGDRSGRCNYVSNGADRRDVVTLMREMISRFEGMPEQEGRG